MTVVADRRLATDLLDPDGSLDDLRRREYGRLDATATVYLDYTGGGLASDTQISAHADYLRHCVLGNPHSASRPSIAASLEAERARHAVLAFLGARPDDYECVFTANASAALKLVGEAYPWCPGGAFALTADNHNSVNGIRELARRAGACVEYVPVTAPELRIDRDAMATTLAAPPRGPRLLAFPAQSNYSGVQHPLDIVAQAHEHGWDVLLDASAYVPTNRLDLAAVGADFVALSIYKICGHPTGVGCLVARRDRLAALRRPWFAGGTVTIASVGAGSHYLHDGAAGFEDGTLNYASLPAVTNGLAHVEAVGREVIHRRVGVLTAWLLDLLPTLRHHNGAPLVSVLGPATTEARGGTVTFLVRDPGGDAVDGRRIEVLAGDRGIAVRSGCFCNPGAGEAALGIDAATLAPWFGRQRPVTFDELASGMRRSGHTLGAVRVSFGVATNATDAACLGEFLHDLIDLLAAPEWVR